MKRKNAIILAFVILIQCFFVNVSAKVNFNDWLITYSGEFEPEEAREKYSVEITDKSKYEGTHSAYVKCQTAEVIDGSVIEMKNPLSKEIPTGKYTLKFYVRTTTAFDGEVWLGENVTLISDMTAVNVEAPSGESKWREFSAEVDYTKVKDAVLNFKFYNNIKAAYIDNVSLVSVDGGENFVVDAGFETYTPPVPGDDGDDDEGDDDDTPDVGGDDDGDDEGDGDDGEYETNDYLPEVMLSSGYAGGILLTWRNPKTDTVTDIKIYDITDNNETLVTDEISVTPSQIIYYKVACEENRNYQFKIVFSYKNSEDRAFYLADSPGDKGGKAYGTWNLRRYMNGAAKYCPADVYIDTNEGHESSSSIKVVSNIDRTKSELISNIYTMVTRNISMESGKSYSISFWIKGEEVVNPPQVHMNFAKFDNSSNTVANSTGTYDWTYKEYTYKYVNQNAMVILVEGLCKGLWFDDIECYELDENGERTGDNLVTDGTFEDIIDKSTGKLAEFKAEAGIGEIKLSFKKPADKYAGAKIYQKVSDKYEYRGIVSGDFEEFVLRGLEENKEYSFRFVPLNGGKAEGEPIDFTVKTLLRDYDITKPAVYKNGTEVTGLSGAGEYTLKTSAKNNLLEDGLMYEQLVGVYHENTLVKVYSTKANLEMTEQYSPYTNIETAFTIPEGAGYGIKVFVVESRENPELYHMLTM